MKNKKIMITLMAITAIALMGGTMAAFTAVTNTTEKVSAARIGIEIVQQEDAKKKVQKSETDQASLAELTYKGLPGDTVNEKVFVRNTEDRDCYVRVVFHRAWINEAGEKVFVAEGKTGEKELKPEDIEITCLSGNWMITTDPSDGEEIVCYYRNILKAGESTDAVMDNFSVLKNNIREDSNPYSGLSVKISYEADAVQTTEAAEAMLAEWGIMAQFDDAGSLTGYTEQ